MTTANYTDALTASKPAAEPMKIVGTRPMSSGTYFILNHNVTVKARALPGLHHYFCCTCIANSCEHVDFVRANDPSEQGGDV